MNKDLYEILKDEREKSENAYAIKLVEKIVFGIVGMILVAFMAVIIKFVIQ